MECTQVRCCSLQPDLLRNKEHGVFDHLKTLWVNIDRCKVHGFGCRDIKSKTRPEAGGREYLAHVSEQVRQLAQFYAWGNSSGQLSHNQCAYELLTTFHIPYKTQSHLSLFIPWAAIPPYVLINRVYIQPSSFRGVTLTLRHQKDMPRFGWLYYNMLYTSIMSFASSSRFLKYMTEAAQVNEQNKGVVNKYRKISWKIKCMCTFTSCRFSSVYIFKVSSLGPRRLRCSFIDNISRIPVQYLERRLDRNLLRHSTYFSSARWRDYHMQSHLEVGCSF